ncbi:MAG TPA: DUF6036 family nucleotidyltransferase [Bryobacteraceae bacterium]|nr:DUF6036 family nucleotidyltransferase [Bryobacteraceae bacterium]
MRALGEEATEPVRVFFTGGATAVLHGWRKSTIDIDLKMVPEFDRLYRAIPALKDRLHINVELASPLDFIPVPEGWEDRGRFIARYGKADFFHFDLYAQALAKVERGHSLDLTDVEEMIRRGLIDREEALRYFARIEPYLYRYPAIDSAAFRRAVEETFGRHTG